MRWVRPFPYGEFKLLSTVRFLVPVLAVARVDGARDRARARIAWLHVALAATPWELGIHLGPHGALPPPSPGGRAPRGR